MKAGNAVVSCWSVRLLELNELLRWFQFRISELPSISAACTERLSPTKCPSAPRSLSLSHISDAPIALPEHIHHHIPNPLTSATMLRRPPTAITLTHEDIAAYEQSRQKKLEQQRSSAGNNKSNAGEQRPQEQAKPSRTQSDRIMGTGGRS